MAVTDWKFVLATLDGKGIGEVLNADERQVTRCLNAVSTAAFKINVNHPRAYDVLTRDLALRCYRNNVLIFHGIMTTPITAVISPPVTYEISLGFRFEKSFEGDTTLAAMLVVNCAAKITAVAQRITATLSKRAIRSTGFGIAWP